MVQELKPVEIKSKLVVGKKYMYVACDIIIMTHGVT